MASGRALAGHVEVDADLEQPQRVHHPGDLGAGQLVDALDDRFEVRGRRHGDREPEVVLVVPLVVVGHAGVLVDDPGGLGDPGGIDAHRDQARLVAEALGVEDRADLAHDPAGLERPHPRDDVVLGEAERPAELLERPRDEWEI